MANNAHAAATAQRHPSLIGAGLLAGAIAGAAIGGATGNFAVWLPVGAVAGLLFGLLLHRGEAKSPVE